MAEGKYNYPPTDVDSDGQGTLYLVAILLESSSNVSTEVEDVRDVGPSVSGSHARALSEQKISECISTALYTGLSFCRYATIVEYKGEESVHFLRQPLHETDATTPCYA